MNSNDQVAALYRVTPRTVRRWRAAGAPIEDGPGLVGWLKAAGKLPASVRSADRRATVAADASAASRTEWADLPAADIGARLGSLEQWSARAESHMRAALNGKDPEGNPVRDPGEFAFWQKAWLAFHTAALNARLAQSKLGIDSGDLIPRAEFERLVRALTGRLAVGIQHTRDQLAPRLTQLTYAEEIAAQLEPVLITALLLDPIAAARHHAAAIGLPGWVCDAFTSGVADVIAAGAAQLDAAQAALLTRSQP